MSALDLVLNDESERSWQARVRKWAAQGGWREHVTHHSLRSPSGWPDLFLVRAGVAIAAELKTNTGHLSAEQADWLDALAEIPGVTACVWRPKDWRQIQSFLLAGGLLYATTVSSRPGVLSSVPGVWDGSRRGVYARRYGGGDRRARAQLRLDGRGARPPHR